MKQIEGGLLTVSGKNSIEIALKKRPHKVEAFFDDQMPPVHPCNPHHHHNDQIEAHIAVRGSSWFGKKQYYIVIIWDVDSNRDVIWAAFE